MNYNNAQSYLQLLILLSSLFTNVIDYDDDVTVTIFFSLFIVAASMANSKMLSFKHIESLIDRLT